MKRWIHAAEDVNETFPSKFREYKYAFILRSTNADFNYDIWNIADQHGAYKITFDKMNPKTGRFYSNGRYARYIVPDEQTAKDIKNDAKINHHIPVEVFEGDYIKWDDIYNIKIQHMDGTNEDIEYHKVRN